MHSDDVDAGIEGKHTLAGNLWQRVIQPSILLCRLMMNAYLGLAFAHVLLLEEELAVEVGDVDGVEVDLEL